VPRRRRRGGILRLGWGWKGDGFGRLLIGVELWMGWWLLCCLYCFICVKKEYEEEYDVSIGMRIEATQQQTVNTLIV
jgi:hypothetical protein